MLRDLAMIRALYGNQRPVRAENAMHPVPARFRNNLR